MDPNLHSYLLLAALAQHQSSPYASSSSLQSTQSTTSSMLMHSNYVSTNSPMPTPLPPTGRLSPYQMLWAGANPSVSSSALSATSLAAIHKQLGLATQFGGSTLR